jgi:hypothetical protein
LLVAPHQVIHLWGWISKRVSKPSEENATATELIDIEHLLELLIKERLGIGETKALTINREFFMPYRKVG